MPREMDNYGAEDFVLPEIKLVQNVGGEEAKAAGADPGDFYCQVTGELIKGTEGIDITVVDIRKKRVYWGRDDITDEPPLCSSMDGKTSMMGDNCDECPNDARCDTPWLVTAQDRRKKCLVHYEVMALKNESPVLIRAGGISTQTVRELLTQLRLNRSLKGEIHRVIVHVTSQKKKTASGEAFSILMRGNKLVEDPIKIAELKELSEQMLGYAVLPEGEPEPERALIAGPKAEVAAPAPTKETVTLTPKDVKVMSPEEAASLGVGKIAKKEPPAPAKVIEPSKPKTAPKIDF